MRFESLFPAISPAESDLDVPLDHPDKDSELASRSKGRYYYVKLSSIAKIVVLATKPKRAAPKAKYIDPIVQGTFSQDGTLQDIVKTLSTRLRDDNTTVVFKSLIVLHTLLRAGSLETTFSYLSTSSISLSLSSHEAPNISAYASYLGARIKSYGNLKRDVIRDKSDRRATGRLRALGVEGGLLREVREVQRMIASLVESKFYSDDIDDDVSMTALRLLVKDLLILFQSVNEGVINVLEHYFEMSHTDATTALKIYKTFCRDTEKVVMYLGVAKKLHNVLNVPIPNLKHAPVSLVRSLEEYLNDPNFATNREEYKENKRIADGGRPKEASSKPAAPTTTNNTTSSTVPSASTAAPTVAPSSFTDFFESIEQAQTSMFNPTDNSSSPQYFQQQATFNPFLQQQATGMPMGFQQGLVPQLTGMGYAAFGGGAGGPFGQPQQQYMQLQPTGFIQPQATGANPFRQSSISGIGGGYGSPFAPQSGFIQSQPTGAFSSSPFAPQQQSSPFAPQIQPQPTGPFGNSSPFPQIQSQPTGSPFPFQSQQQPLGQQSAPFPPSTSSFASNNIPAQAPLLGQKTGARNPFNPAPGEAVAPRAPLGPSMNALASAAFGGGVQYGQNGLNAAQQEQQQQQQQQQQQPQSNPFPSSFSSPQAPLHSQTLPSSTPAFSPGSYQPSLAPITQIKTGLMGSVASAFALNRSSSPVTYSSASFSSTSAPAPFSSITSLSAPAWSSPPSGFNGGSTPAPLNTQPTGYGGSNVKPFQPTSSFGSALREELGGGSPMLGSSSNQFTGQTSQVPQQQPLQQQATGFNPFRGSTLPPLNSNLSGQPSGAFASNGASGNSGAFGGAYSSGRQNGDNGNGSLI